MTNTARTRRLAAGAAALTLLLAGCGSGDDASTSTTAATQAPAADDAALAEQAVADYVEAFTSRDPAGACALMSEQGQAHVIALQEADSCEQAVENVLAGVPDDWMERFRAHEITKVAVKGDVAVVKRADDSDDGVAAPPVVRRVGDAWLVEFER